MKKLALMMIVAMIMIPIIASAADDWDGFSGKYRMVATGSCIHSENGYYDPAPNGWITAKPGVVYAGTTVLDGIWIFTQDTDSKTGNKIGTYSQTLHATVTPPPRVPPPGKGPPLEVPGGIRLFLPAVEPVSFTYEIDDDGNITVTVGTIKLTGGITTDWAIMTLVSADNVQNFGVAPFWWTICNTARTLIRMGN